MFSILMYADDTTLFWNFDNNYNEDVINAELNSVYSWLCSNRLSLNVEKTKCVASLQKGPHVAIYQSRENRS